MSVGAEASKDVSQQTVADWTHFVHSLLCPSHFFCTFVFILISFKYMYNTAVVSHIYDGQSNAVRQFPGEDCTFPVHLQGGVVVERQTRDRELAGSSLGRALRHKNSGQVSHTYG